MASFSGTRLTLNLLGRQLRQLSLRGCRNYSIVSPTARLTPSTVCLPHIYSHVTSGTKRTHPLEPAPTRKVTSPLRTHNVVDVHNANLNQIFNCMAIDRQNITVGDVLPVVSYDCPKSPGNVADISVPESIKQIIPLDSPGANDEIARESPGQDAPMKQASENLYWRRRMMKKHQLRRVRDRHHISLKKTAFDRRARLNRIYAHKLNAIRKKGTEFDAMAYVNTNLQAARIGGYYINVLRVPVPDEK